MGGIGKVVTDLASAPQKAVGAIAGGLTKPLEKFGGLGKTLSGVINGTLSNLFKPENIIKVAAMAVGGPLAPFIPAAFSLGTGLAGGGLNLQSLLSAAGPALSGPLGGLANGLLGGQTSIDTFASGVANLGLKNPTLLPMIENLVKQGGLDPMDATRLLTDPNLSSILNESRGFSLNG